MLYLVLELGKIVNLVGINILAVYQNADDVIWRRNANDCKNKGNL